MACGIIYVCSRQGRSGKLSIKFHDIFGMDLMGSLSGMWVIVPMETDLPALPMPEAPAAQCPLCGADYVGTMEDHLAYECIA